MKYTINIIENYEEGWDKNILKYKGSIFQTVMWVNAVREHSYQKPYFFQAFDEYDKLCGCLVLFKTCKAHDFLVKFGTFFGVLRHFFFPVFYWREGPIIFSGDKIAVFNAIMKKVREFIGRSVLKDSSSGYKFNSEFFKCKKAGTFIIGLDKDINTLFSNIKKGTRKNIRRLEKEFSVKIFGEEGLNDYLKILKESRKRAGLLLPPEYPSKALFNHLREHIKIFLVFKDDKPIDGLGVLCFNGVLKELAVARSNFSVSNKLYTQDLLKWNIIKWGHENSFKSFDLSGVSLNPKTKKEKNIYRFKAKWGGKLKSFNIFSSG